MASRSERYNVELTAEDKASQVINEVAEAREKLSEEPVVVDITADDEASGTIGEVAEGAENLDGTEAEVDLAADDAASEPIGDVTEATEELDGTEAQVELTADDAASGTIGDVTGAVTGYDGMAASATLDATDDASSVIDDVSTALADLDGETAEPEIDADDLATGQIDDVSTALTDLDGERASPELDASDLATPQIDNVSEELVTLDGETASPDIDVTGDDESTVSDVTGALGELDGESAEASLNVEGADATSVAVGGIVGNLETIAGGALTAAAGAGLTAVFSGAAQHILDVQTLSEVTGTSLETATGLQEQWDFVGGSVQQLLTAIGRVNDKMGESPEIATKLGITIGENQSPLDTFVAVVDALNSGQLTANERLSVATEIFGRRGAATVLKVGTEIGNLGDAIDDIPEWQVITENDVQAAIEYKHNMDEIGDAAAEAAQKFLPVAVTVLNSLQQFGGLIGDMRTPDVTGLSNWLDAIDPETLDQVTNSFTELGGNLETLLFQVDALKKTDIEAALGAGIPPAVLATAKLTGGAYQFLGEQMADTAATAGALDQALLDNKVSQQEWLTITADGVITLDEVEAAIGNVDTAMDDSTTTVEDYAGAYDEAVASIDEHKAALQEDIGVLDDQIEKLNDQAEALGGSGDSFLDVREATRKAGEAADNYAESLVEVEGDTRTATQVQRDQEEALDGVVRASVDVAEAVVDAAAEQATANGTTLTAIQRSDMLNSSLITQAKDALPDAQDEILKYIGRINGIPESKVTEILADDDPDNIAQMEALLADLSRTRSALVQAQIDEEAKRQAAYELEVLTTPRHVLISPVYTTSGGAQYTAQHGSTFTPHDRLGLVGEDGPELVVLPQGSEVLPAWETDEAMRNGNGNGAPTIYNTVVHMPPGTPTSTFRLMRRYQRRNGLEVFV